MNEMQTEFNTPEEITPPTKKPFSPIAWGLLSGLCVIIVYTLGSGIIGALFLDSPGDSVFPYIIGLSQLLFMLLPVLFFAKYSQLESKEILRFNFDTNSKQLLLAFTGFIGFMAFQIGYMSIQESLLPPEWLEYYHQLMESVENSYKLLIFGDTTMDLIRSLIIAAMIPAISEEFLFRGLLQSHLEKGMNPLWAILITSFIFAIIHINMVQFIPLLGIGLLLGFLAYRTRSIVLPIIIHFTNNALSVSTIHFTRLSEMEEAAETLPMEYSLPLLIFGLVIIVFSIKSITTKEDIYSF